MHRESLNTPPSYSLFNHDDSYVLPNLSIVDPVSSGPPRLVCVMCNRKLPITADPCKCGRSLCFNHRYANEHDCSYDYKTEWKSQLQKNNPIIKKSKVDKI